MNPISFKANYITTTKISELDGSVQKPMDVSFIEFTPEHPNDIEVLNSLDFKRFSKYTKNDFAEYPAIKLKNRVYGLTTQTDSFERPDANKILGIVDVYSEHNQTNAGIHEIFARCDASRPVKITKIEEVIGKVLSFGLIDLSKQPERKYKGVGSAMIEALKTIYNDIHVFSNKRLIPFFQKNGFKQTLPENKKFLNWIKK